MHRRELLKNGAVALTVAATKPLFAWQGANNRVRMAVIGMGGRSGRVFDSLTRLDDVQFTVGMRGRAEQAAELSGRQSPTCAKARGGRRLSPCARPQRHRRGAHRYARLLARQDHGGRARRRQARLRRKADREQHRAHQHDARRLQQVSESGRAGRHAAAELGSLHRSEVEDGAARSSHPRPHPARRRLFAEQAGRR